jgi:hypothetical protein
MSRALQQKAPHLQAVPSVEQSLVDDHDLRVPVVRVPVTLHLHDGRVVDGCFFLPPGDPVDTLLEESSGFVPVLESSGVHIYARHAIAVIEVDSELAQQRPPDPFEASAPYRAVRAKLYSGKVVEGELRVVAPVGRTRTADILNQPERAFTLRRGDSLVVIAKHHVEHLEEA